MKLALFASLLVACNGKATRADCTAMLDHYLDLTIAADPDLAGLSPAEASAAREMKKTLRKTEPAYKKVSEQCEAEITTREAKCAMKSQTPEAWQACID